MRTGTRLWILAVSSASYLVRKIGAVLVLGFMRATIVRARKCCAFRLSANSGHSVRKNANGMSHWTGVLLRKSHEHAERGTGWPIGEEADSGCTKVKQPNYAM